MQIHEAKMIVNMNNFKDELSYVRFTFIFVSVISSPDPPNLINKLESN